MILFIGLSGITLCWLFAMLSTIKGVNGVNKSHYEFILRSFFFWLAIVIAILTGIKI